ncbi:succinylglutamate desuccinylase/aspartoacylase family protein [Vibrio fortis]
MSEMATHNQTQVLEYLHSLNVDDLPSGDHTLSFAVATNAIGQWQQLPVRVFKGRNEGKKVVITAGVHGDEQNGIMTAMKVAQRLVEQDIAGCVTIVPTINLSGILNHSRNFFPVDPDTSPSNLNRFFPGNVEGNEVERYLGTLWNNLLLPNADIAIDLHTQTSGTCYPLYIFADYRVEKAKQMAALMNADVVLNDPGEKGVLETAWNTHGVPSITVEVGSGRYFERELVERATQGVMNILIAEGVIEGEVSKLNSPLEGDKIISIKAQQGGFVEPQVSLMQKVEKDDLLAIQYDSLGKELLRYTAPESGTVISHNLETLRAPGSLIVRLIK